LDGLAAAAKLAKPASNAFLEAAAAAAAVSSPSADAQAAGADSGGGLWVAQGQEAVLISTIVGGNRAMRSGAGIYVDKGASLELQNEQAGPTAVSYNNCTAGSGGALFMNDKSKLLAVQAALNNNRVGGCWADEQCVEPSRLGQPLPCLHKPTYQLPP
jgi:hypothetical protein